MTYLSTKSSDSIRSSDYSNNLPSSDILALLGDQASLKRVAKFSIKNPNQDELIAYHELRRQIFVQDQSIFDQSDLDEIDLDPKTIVFVALDKDNRVVGGVRLAPVSQHLNQGWWTGSRLVVDKQYRGTTRIAIALIKSACATAEQQGALRFEASVQLSNKRFFESLGWKTLGEVLVAGLPHVKMAWPINRIQNLVDSTKLPLGALLVDILPKDPWIGDDAAPIPGSDLVVATDSILSSMVERDPFWAGWCSVVVNVNDLAAMGAKPVALLDAVSGGSSKVVKQVLCGIREASQAYGVPIIGGHSQLQAPCSLSVTMLGRTTNPIPGGGGKVGDQVSLTIDLGGSWRQGYSGLQWDSTTWRTPDELQEMITIVEQCQPNSAKDVSMAGIVGTLGMLAEASGCGAEIEVELIPRPSQVTLGEWLSCFPGFGIITTQSPAQSNRIKDIVTPATTAVCGRLIEGSGVDLIWPDGQKTKIIKDVVTGFGPTVKL